MSALTPSSFVYNNDTSSTTRWGFIAQQLASTSPHFIDYYDAAGNPRTIDTTSILAVAVKAIQELIAQVRDLAATVTSFAHSFASDDIRANNRLCVGSTCVSETQLQAMLASAGQSVAPTSPPPASPTSVGTAAKSSTATSTEANIFATPRARGGNGTGSERANHRSTAASSTIDQVPQLSSALAEYGINTQHELRNSFFATCPCKHSVNS